MGWSEILVWSFLLMCGFTQCQKEGPPSGVHRHVCRESNDDYDCIFLNIFVDDLDSVVLFGNANQQKNNQSWLTFVNSTLRILPKSLVDTYANVELLKLQRLQIETIERSALSNGRKIKDLHLSYNNIASLDEDVFDNLHSLEVLVMVVNRISSIPVRLFQYTINLKVVAMASNYLKRIEDDTFLTNTNLEEVYMQNNGLIYFDLSLIKNLKMAHVNNNLLQGLNIPARMIFLDASNNQIRNVVTQTENMVEFLNLSNNKLHTTAWLKPFKKLRSLDLSFNEIENITPRNVNKLTGLNTLKLNNNRLFTFDIPSSLNRSLKILDLSHNNLVFVEDNLKSFELLEELYLDHNSIVNVNLGALIKLSNLTLSYNDWDCGSLENVSSRFPATTVTDYFIERKCKLNYTYFKGICCKVSNIHHRLLQNISKQIESETNVQYTTEQFNPAPWYSTTETYAKSPTLEENWHVCRDSTDSYDCIFRHVFIDNLNNGVLFGHAHQQWNNESKLTFLNSTLKSLPKSLVDTYANVELLNLERLQIETIQRNALANGRKIKKLQLNYNNIGSLDEGVFDNLESLEILMMDGNHLSRLPARLFQYTSNLQVVYMSSNNLDRIEDDTFRHTPKLESVIVASNRLIHFDLSLIPSLYDVDVKNNLLQELIVPSRIANLDASNNQIRSVSAQTGNLVEILNLSYNKLNTTAWLTPFTKLRSLDLSFNEIEDITATDFNKLTGLNMLKLNNNRLFTFDIPSSLNRSLKILDLSHNNLVFVEDNLKPFGMLEELYLDHNSIVTVNLKTMSKLRNLTLSHNDWDCSNLANLSSRLPATTVVDYDIEKQCKQNYTRITGICCTASEIPYHDRLIKYMAEVSAYERADRANGRCSGDTVYEMAKNVSDAIASYGLLPSYTLAKEVQALKSDVQRLEDSINQARSQMEKDEGKIDELMRRYHRVPQWIWKPWEKLQRVFDRLKERDAFMLKETVVREDRKRAKDKELEDIVRQVDQKEIKLNGKINNFNELQKRITEKISKVKKLEKEKRKQMYTNNQLKKNHHM